jgi:hypothetical protein
LEELEELEGLEELEIVGRWEEFEKTSALCLLPSALCSLPSALYASALC